jgi:hypothetical protein
MILRQKKNAVGGALCFEANVLLLTAMRGGGPVAACAARWPWSVLVWQLGQWQRSR